MFCEPMQRAGDPRLFVIGKLSEKLVGCQEEPSLGVLTAPAYRGVLGQDVQEHFDMGG